MVLIINYFHFSLNNPLSRFPQGGLVDKQIITKPLLGSWGVRSDFFKTPLRRGYE
jgi:hypothetical protein